MSLARISERAGDSSSMCEILVPCPWLKAGLGERGLFTPLLYSPQVREPAQSQGIVLVCATPKPQELLGGRRRL